MGPQEQRIDHGLKHVQPSDARCWDCCISSLCWGLCRNCCCNYGPVQLHLLPPDSEPRASMANDILNSATLEESTATSEPASTGALRAQGAGAPSQHPRYVLCRLALAELDRVRPQVDGMAAKPEEALQQSWPLEPVPCPIRRASTTEEQPTGCCRGCWRRSSAAAARSW